MRASSIAAGTSPAKEFLSGQFADLEEPTNAVVLRATTTPEKNVHAALRKLNLNAARKA